MEIEILSSGIKVQHGLFSKKIEFSQIKEIELAPMISLVDEIGFVIRASNELVVSETDSGFWGLANLLRLDERLVDDWYCKVEKGESFVFLNPFK